MNGQHTLFQKTVLLLTAVLIIVNCINAVSAEDWPEAPEMISESVIMMDADTGQILYEKNADQRMYPASITKIMTAMLAILRLEPDDLLTMTQEAYNAVPRSSSHIALQPGEEMRARDALGALGVSSANDAANLLAVGVSGSLSEFATLMTETARELGAMNTQFRNANGLPDTEHYTTARDMAIITQAALKVEGLTEYFSSKSWTIAPTNMNADGHNLVNKNRFVSGVYALDGLVMSKTGWTSSSLHTFVTVAKRNGTTLIVVAMRSNLLEDKYQDTMKLLDYGFGYFSRVKLLPATLDRMIDLAGYQVDEDQYISVLLPIGISMSSLSIVPSSQGITYPEGGRARAGVSLKLAGSTGPALPSGTIYLTKRPEVVEDSSENAPALIADALQEAAAESTENPDLPYLAIGLACIAGGFWFGVLIARFRTKRKHRAVTAEKIRRFRQQLGTDDRKRKR